MSYDILDVTPRLVGLQILSTGSTDIKPAACTLRPVRVVSHFLKISTHCFCTSQLNVKDGKQVQYVEMLKNSELPADYDAEGDVRI